MNDIKNFLWGTFNYRNKGIKLYRWPMVGYQFMKIAKGKTYIK